MLKCVAVEDDKKPFNYQEWAGPHIKKLTYKKYTFFGLPNLQYTKLTVTQKAKIDGFEVMGFEMINGYSIHGKEFSDPTDNNSGMYIPEANVIIMAKEGRKGAVAMLPNGEVHALSSKSWKPELKHFKF